MIEPNCLTQRAQSSKSVEFFWWFCRFCNFHQNSDVIETLYHDLNNSKWSYKNIFSHTRHLIHSRRLLKRTEPNIMYYTRYTTFISVSPFPTPNTGILDDEGGSVTHRLFHVQAFRFVYSFANVGKWMCRLYLFCLRAILRPRIPSITTSDGVEDKGDIYI